jgi:hypothetical protein
MDVDGCCAPKRYEILSKRIARPGRTAPPEERAERDGEANRGLARKPLRGLAFLEPKLLRPSFLDGLRKARTWLEQDLERESRGAAGREQMTRLPEVCV